MGIMTGDDTEIKDLTGDPIYDEFKSNLKPNLKLLGAKIFERKIARPTEARKIIVFYVDPCNGKKTLEIPYNYNRLNRKINAR